MSAHDAPMLQPMGPAERELVWAIADLWEQRRPLPPCRTVERGCDWWLSNKQAERQKAAYACDRCPVAGLCRATADELGATFGVFGGIDYTPTTTRVRR